ncbi:MAG: M48 family metalloprotease [Candidatus Heimdallarchaeota archaeon]|nr:MAG: M48 family metalloprotease [Candidatus Heimdallarchaeota archaeon]
MDVEQYTKRGVPLPVSDFLLLAIYALFYPLVFGLLVIGLGYLINNDLLFYISLTVISLGLFLTMLLFFYKSYTELRSHAIEVAHVHFQPSWREVIIHLITQVYSVVFLGILLAIFFGSTIIDLPQWQYLGLALIISLGYQGMFIILSLNSKRKLLATAQTPVSTEIVNHVRQNHPNNHLINEFRFADVELASLFLSAGVMTLGWKKNICLISQYFNWKLTDEELIAVLSHEEGHLARHHIRTAYLILGTEGILRTFRIFIVLNALILILNDLPILAFNTFSLIFLILIILVFLTSTCLVLTQRYRVYLQEIRVDCYGGNLVGHEILANTLKKLPSIIPAPIGSHQLDFLTFRIALLREQANKLKSKTE